MVLDYDKKTKGESLLTRKGWKGVLIREEVYDQATRYIDEVNFKRGKRKFNSMADFVNQAIDYYVSTQKERDIQDP